MARKERYDLSKEAVVWRLPPPPDGKRYVDHVDLKNPALRLRITQSMSRIWIVKYRVGRGRGSSPTKQSLGAYVPNADHVAQYLKASAEASRYWAEGLEGRDAHDPKILQRIARRKPVRAEQCLAEDAASTAEPAGPKSLVLADIWGPACDRRSLERKKPWSARYMANMKARLANIEAYLRDPADPSRPIKRADEVTYESILHMKAVMASAQEYNKTFQMLRRILDWCVGEKLIPENPARRHHIGERPVGRRFAHLEDEAMAEFLRRLGDPGYVRTRPQETAAAFLKCLLLTGLRSGDAFRTIRHRDDGAETTNYVDFERKVLVMRVHKSAAAGSEPSYVGLIDEVLEIMRACIVDRRNPYVFQSRDERRSLTDPVGESTIRRVFSQVTKDLEVAGFGRFVKHSLRHSFGSKLGRSGVALQLIKDQMQHRDLRTTLLYVQNGMEFARAGAESTARALAGLTTPVSSSVPITIAK